MVSKVLIANRGAIARRVIQTCNRLGLKTVAVYSDADVRAPYLQEATEVAHLPGNKATDTYINQTALLEIAKLTKADAVHPGYGFLSEDASFAQAVANSDMHFVGPSPNWLMQMGDKVNARQLMQQYNFPTFSGSEIVSTLEQAHEQANHIGYPVMLKPSGGGGGMGMYRVESKAELEKAYNQAAHIAEQAFGNGAVYLEQWIEQPRHIEYQIIADGRGSAKHVYERECSIQRRHQKLIEESPAPNVDRKILKEIADAAADTCAKLGYDNIGTMETLVDQHMQTGFLEMNTRIQVEHGVTEMITGLDLVEVQLALVRGADLPEIPPAEGHAIEARIYAEDPHTLMPSTGRLSTFEIPNLHGIRIDTGYQEGQDITPYYDAMLAKVIAHGQSRELAIGRLLVALKAIVINGVTTNIPLLQKVLQSENFMDGKIHPNFIPQMNEHN